MQPFEGIIQEIQNQGQMRWVQYWRNHSHLFDQDELMLKHLWMAAFHQSAITTLDLTQMGLEQVHRDIDSKDR